MVIQLIEGQFSPNEAIDILTQMIHVKIKYHEDKIKICQNEEDVKMREKKIKFLQRELSEAREYIEKNGQIKLTSQITL